MEVHSIIKDYDLATGNKLINNYMILKEIGRGVHGKVKLAQNMDTHQLVAIKIVDKKNRRRQMGYSLLRGGGHGTENITEENEEKIKREISILQKCNHPNIVKLLQVLDVPESRKIYMILEYTEKGEIEWRNELDQPILSISEARRIFRDIVNGLDYLHYLGIIHRDIKPANILLSHEGVAKISDFGVSYYSKLLAVNHDITNVSEEAFKKVDRELAETAGTPAFFAPELCCASESNQPKSPRISKAIDVWALGVTLYCFIFGTCPFIAATEFELFDAIPTQPLTFPDIDQVGFEIQHELKDLINKLLAKNPEERITLDQVKVHPWVIEDLDNIEEWLHQSDPQYYYNQQQQQQQQQMIAVAEEEEDHHISMMNRIRQSIRKLSISFGNKRSSKSRPLSLQAPSAGVTNNNRLSQPAIITSITPTVSLSTGHTLIFNSSERTRKISTASSNSGLTVGKFRGTMTSMAQQ